MKHKRDPKKELATRQWIHILFVALPLIIVFLGMTAVTIQGFMSLQEDWRNAGIGLFILVNAVLALGKLFERNNKRITELEKIIESERE